MKTSRNSSKKVFSRYMQEKLAVTVLVITLALFGLVAVLYNLINANEEEYSQIVLNQHSSYDSRTLPYRRGDIVDRNETYLATSEKVYNLILDPNQINKDREDYLEATVSTLVEVFGYERADVMKAIDENPRSYYVRYARQLSADQKEAFEKAAEEKNKAFAEAKTKQKVKGVWFEDEFRRFYPYKSLACNVVGFAYDNGKQGSGGIEQYYNSQLIGTNGREYGYLDDESNMERVIKSPENGYTIMSTIDVNIQKIIEKYIDVWMDGIGSQTAAVIVMDPNNGEILAMSSNRRFDLNNPRDLTPLYTQQEIDAMDEKAKSEVWNKLWRNYCVSDTYEPGSPAKPLTVAACLEEGVIGQNETFDCDGFQDVGGYHIKCVNIYGHGTLTLEQTLMKSCNDALMQMAARLGTSKFCKYQQLFGMGQKTGIDLPGEADTAGLIHHENKMGPTELATSSFGQGYNTTMVQMAAAISSVINGGSYYEPHVVRQIINDQKAVVKRIEPVVVRETVSQATSDFVRTALFHTVDSPEGTGKAARVAGYKIGGKTGTAEKVPRAAHNYLLSFAGFAPADDPQVLVYVVIDTPNLPGKEQAHSTFATEIFQNILTEVLPYINVFPDTDAPAPEDSASSQQEESSNNGGDSQESESSGGEPGESSAKNGESGTAAEQETTASAESGGNGEPASTAAPGGENAESAPEPEGGRPNGDEIITDDGFGLPDNVPTVGTIAPSGGSVENIPAPGPGDAVPGA